MHPGLAGECSLVVALENVKRCSGDQVRIRLERDMILAVALVGDDAIEWGRRLFRVIDGDLKLKPD